MSVYGHIPLIHTHTRWLVGWVTALNEYKFLEMIATTTTGNGNPREQSRNVIDTNWIAMFGYKSVLILTDWAWQECQLFSKIIANVGHHHGGSCLHLFVRQTKFWPALFWTVQFSEKYCAICQWAFGFFFSLFQCVVNVALRSLALTLEKAIIIVRYLLRGKNAIRQPFLTCHWAPITFESGFSGTKGSF